MLQDFLYNDGFIWVTFRVAATLLVTAVITRLLRATWLRIGCDTIHQKFIKNVLSILIWIVGIVVAFSWLPHFSDAATALIASSGLIVLGIGLAAQETLGNAFSGMFISMFKPFEVGDRVHLTRANITGFIEDITIRHTVVRTLLNSRVIIPNSLMNSELIENAHFSNPQAANFIDVTITYHSDVETAREIMARVMAEHPDFVDTRTDEQKQALTPLVPVLVRNLGLYGVELRASMWTATISSNFAACSDVRRSILEEFAKEGIGIAYIDALIQREKS